MRADEWAAFAEVGVMSNKEPTRSVTQSPASISSPSVRDEIGAANARFMEAFRARDVAGVAACYTSDAQLLPAHSDVVEGTSAIADYWGGALASGVAGARLESTEVDALGDRAIEVGRYAIVGADGGTIDRGKYLVVWRREGGSWKLHRDIWTTSVPAPHA
jgi:uncharacterized protein (TIGR02246 family)